MSIHNTRSFVSHAKLMLSGEYLVLSGARALALPLRFKQELSVHESAGYPVLKWKSMVFDHLWLETTLLLPDLHILETNLPEISETLRNILGAAQKMNTSFLSGSHELTVISQMDFDPAWGMGSGSSLVSNIAFWADCDPYKLNELIFNGSGYDIACARATSPIIYKLDEGWPDIRKATFQPAFSENLYFIYLNRKQNSKEAINQFDRTRITTDDLEAVSALALEFEKATDLHTFQTLIDRHEEIIARVIGEQPVKRRLFDDFYGSVKSLGAWGGDFILAASAGTYQYVRDYFHSKNMTMIYRYNEVVMNY